jgi:hypothetical protein
MGNNGMRIWNCFPEHIHAEEREKT